MSIGFNEDDLITKETKIIIAGVGGGGGNAINYMEEKQIEGVEYIAYNTDFQDLRANKAPYKVPLGKEGLGAGAKPEVAKQAAEETEKEIKKSLENADMVFITAGMGGGTGTGASPVIARIAKEQGKLTVAIVTKPFEFEGRKKMKTAMNGIEELKKYVDSIIIIPNEKVIDSDTSMIDAYLMVNEVLRIGVSTITDLITKNSLLNLDYSDVKTILKDSGVAIFGYGKIEEGEEVELAVERATENPLLEQTMTGAKNVLVNVVAPRTLSMGDYKKITNKIREKINIEDDEHFIHGVSHDDSVKTVQVSIIAAKFDENPKTTIIEETEVHSDSTNSSNSSLGILLPTYD